MKLLSAAAACALLIAAPAWAQMSNSQNGPPHPNLSPQDWNFVQRATALNRAEADFGRMAQEKGTTPAITLSGRWNATDYGMIAGNWLDAIMSERGSTPRPYLTPSDRELGGRLQSLSGDQFDRAYIYSQVAILEEALPAFRAEAMRGRDQALRIYADSLLPVLQQHLASAEALSGSLAERANAGSTAPAGSGSSKPR
jgi:putative membrane protein